MRRAVLAALAAILTGCGLEGGNVTPAGTPRPAVLEAPEETAAPANVTDPAQPAAVVGSSQPLPDAPPDLGAPPPGAVVDAREEQRCTPAPACPPVQACPDPAPEPICPVPAAPAAPAAAAALRCAPAPSGGSADDPHFQLGYYDGYVSGYRDGHKEGTAGLPAASFE